MDVLDILDDHQRYRNYMRILNPRVRVLRDRRNPMEMFEEQEFRRRFRLSKDSARNLADLLQPNLQRDSRGAGIPVLIQLLIALR